MSLTVSTTYFLGLTPELFAYQVVAVDALAGADILGLDVEVLGEAIKKADIDQGKQFRTQLGKMLSAFAENDDCKGRQSQLKLAAIVRGLKHYKWTTVVRSVEQYFVPKGELLATPEERLLSARRNMGGKATNRKIGESTSNQNKKALAWLAVQSAYGDISSRDILFDIAKGISDMAHPAIILVDLMEDLECLAKANDRRTFTKKAIEILETEKRSFVRAMERDSWKQVGRDMIDFETALFETIIELDFRKQSSIPNWRTDPEVISLFHDRIQTPLKNMRKIGDAMLSGKLTPDSPLPAYHFSSVSEDELLGIIINAAKMNTQSLMVSDIHLEIEIPEGIQAAMSKEEREKLKMVLFNLIQNSIRYCDRTKPKCWIKISWDAARKALVVTDNGRGIKNIQRVWQGDYREYPQIFGTGQGLKSVREDVGKIAWNIELESIYGIGTTFILTPPLGMLQKIPLDVETLTLEAVRQMSPEEQITVAEIVFHWVYFESIRFFEALKNLPENLSHEEATRQWRALFETYEQKMKKVDELGPIATFNMYQAGTELAGVAANPLSPLNGSPVEKLYLALFTAITKITRTQIMAGLALRELDAKTISLKEAKAKLINPQQIVTRRLREDGTYYHGAEHGFVELEDTLFKWFETNFSRKLRLANGWQFTGRMDQAPEKVESFEPTSWPPHPVEDLHFRSYLSLLGWKMRVQTKPDGTIFIVLTSTDTIPTKEVPKLAQKTVADIYQLFASNENIIRAIPLGNISSLEEQRDRFMAEIHRLIFLLPMCEDPNLTAVIQQLREALSQGAAVIISEMTISIENLETKTETWEQAMDAIPQYPPPKYIEKIAGDDGLLVPSLLKQLGDLTVEWLREHNPIEVWNAKAKSWSLTLPDEEQATEAKKSEGPFAEFEWPPNPDRQLALKTLLELLDWEMDVMKEMGKTVLEIRSKP